MDGQGRLYWMVATGEPKELIPDATFGFIISEKINPATTRPYWVTIVDEDQELHSDGVDLTINHNGTLVEFNARKIPGHEVYHCTEVKPKLGIATESAMSVSRQGILIGRLNNDIPRRFFGIIAETSPGSARHEIDPDDTVEWSPASLPNEASGKEVAVAFELDDNPTPSKRKVTVVKKVT